MTEPNLDLRCNSCDKPMVFHGRFATWVCRLFTRLEGIPATYVRKPVFTREFADAAISIGELPISGAELHDMKQGPCLSAYEEMTIEEARARFPSPAEDIRFLTTRKPLWLKPFVLTAELEREMMRLLIHYRYQHRLRACEIPIRAEMDDLRCDLCKQFDAIPTDAINWLLREN